MSERLESELGLESESELSISIEGRIVGGRLDEFLEFSGIDRNSAVRFSGKADSEALGRFRFSRALSRSSNFAISSNALILAFNSFSSRVERGLPSFCNFAKSLAVRISRLSSEAVVVLSSATWSTIL